MVELSLVVVVLGGLLLWSALATCTLDAFVPQAEYRSQLTGPTAYQSLLASLMELSGIRELERRGDDVLLSVMPVPTSMDRGYGLFVLVRPAEGGGAALFARSRLPLPGRSVDFSLRQLERSARMRVAHWTGKEYGDPRQPDPPSDH